MGESFTSKDFRTSIETTSWACLVAVAYYFGCVLSIGYNSPIWEIHPNGLKMIVMSLTIVISATVGFVKVKSWTSRTLFTLPSFVIWSISTIIYLLSYK